MKSSKDESREYFRISCPVLISVRDCGSSTLPTMKAADYFPQSSQVNLQRELNQMDQENAHLLHAIAENDRSLSHYLGVINKKIDAVARQLAVIAPDEEPGSEQQVSLSEGGITFRTVKPVPEQQAIALRVTLLPSYIGLSVYARITRCEETGHGDCLISAEFERLGDSDRQILARHVMQVQMAEHRKRSHQE